MTKIKFNPLRKMRITEEYWNEVEDKMFMEKGKNPEPYQVCNRILNNLKLEII